jgi:hypothetical protein
MPYKQRRRRRGATGDYDLDSLRKQNFPEWWSLCCGHWRRQYHTINSRVALVRWYAANRSEFDQLHIPPKFGPGRQHPADRHAGQWFEELFPEYGPRLVVDPEQFEQRCRRILDGHWLPSHSFHKQSDRLIKNWKSGRMPNETELRDHVSLCVPSRNFPDGFESSTEYLERHKLLTADEESLLFEESMR